MGKKQYVIESQFEDLHGNADDEAPDLELDLSDSNNPIIQAALSNEDWKPPAEDDEVVEDDEASDDEADDEDDDIDDEDDDSIEDSDDDEVEDEDDDDQAEDDDEDDDEDEKYSKKVQKRIEREREARRRDNEAADRRIRNLEKKAELRDKRDSFGKEKGDAERKLADLRKKKIAALEEGDQTEALVDIDEQILDIKADMKAKEIELRQIERDLESDDVDEPNANSGTPAEGKKFLEKYPQFHTNKQFRDVLLLADKAVAARGFDKNTKAYYAEIEKILQPQFPKIVKRPTKIVTKPSKKRRSAVGSTTKAGTRRSASATTRTRRGVIRLTKTDQQQMAIFGMDPKNPADAKAWAEGKGI